MAMASRMRKERAQRAGRQRRRSVALVETAKKTAKAQADAQLRTKERQLRAEKLRKQQTVGTPEWEAMHPEAAAARKAAAQSSRSSGFWSCLCLPGAGSKATSADAKNG